MRITVLSNGDFRHNSQLHRDILELSQPSYEDASVVLAAALSNYDTVYLSRDDDDKLISFFMAGHEDVYIAAQSVPTIHLGWTCAAQETKGLGAARLLYSQFIDDSLKLQKSKGESLLLWGTTATPIGFYLYHKHFVGVQPGYDGTYPGTVIEVAEALRRRLGVISTNANPFVLPGISKARFSQDEIRRIKEISANKAFTLFKDMGIDERNGDRLLVVCRLPL